MNSKTGEASASTSGERTGCAAAYPRRAAGRASKRKGSAGERELCALLTARGFPAQRNDQRYIGGRGNPDIDAQGLEGYHFEVKRVERLNVHEAMRQAVGDAVERVPAVVHRRSREPWLITMRLEDWLQEKGAV